MGLAKRSSHRRTPRFWSRLARSRTRPGTRRASLGPVIWQSKPYRAYGREEWRIAAIDEQHGVRGFMGARRNIQIDPTPADENAVAEPPDIDLVAIARGCQNYLAHNPVREKGWQCRIAFWGLHMPVFEPLGIPSPSLDLIDPVVEGDTDCRMDYAYIRMREMAGAAGEVRDAEEAVRNRALGYIHQDGLAYINGVVLGIPIDEKDRRLWAPPSWATGKVLSSQSHLFRLALDESHRDRARHIFEGLRRLATWDTGRAYHLGGHGAWRDNEWYHVGSEAYPWVVEPLADYWDVTGDDEALDFACATGRVLTAPPATTGRKTPSRARRGTPAAARAPSIPPPHRSPSSRPVSVLPPARPRRSHRLDGSRFPS